MSRKLTPKEIRNRTIGRVISRIETIEKDYGQEITKAACSQYANSKRAESKLTREIAQREKELQELKSKREQ